MKKFRVIVLLATFFSTGFLFSQGLPAYIDVENKQPFEEEEICCKLNNLDRILTIPDVSFIEHEPYDVLEYDLYLDWYEPLSREKLLRVDTLLVVDSTFNEDSTVVTYDTTKVPDSTYYLDRRWNGVNNIKICIDSADVDTISFDSQDLVITEVKINNELIEPKPEVLSNKLLIPLPVEIGQGDTVEIRISYNYTRQGLNSRGFWLYPKGQYAGKGPSNEPIYTEERIAYTMSEPQDARRWMPCNDAPYDKAASKISVRVPEGFTVASIGLLTEVADSEDNSKVYIWEDDTPVTTYLMHVSASIYKEYSEWYTRISNPEEEVEVKYYIWEKDYEDTLTNGTVYNAKHAFRRTVEMMECYSEVFGEYPFKKYGMVSVQPFQFGGMEHQTMTTVKRSWLRGWSESGIAHELAHQWLGDLVTCATWKDIWINEGGATFSEGLWQEYLYGKNSYYNYMQGTRNLYLKQEFLYERPIYDVPVNQIFGKFYRLSYQKASWIYHMLREQLGDELFFLSLQDIFSTYGFNSLESKDYIDIFKKNVSNPPIPFETFFDQWLFSAGHPIYNLSTVSNVRDTNDVKSTVEISQVQEGELIPDVFSAQLELVFYGPDSTTYSHQVINDQRVQEYEINVPFIPDSVKLNLNKSLFQVQESIVSVREADTRKPGRMNIYPNPVYGGRTGRFSADISGLNMINIGIYNNLGRKIKTVYSGLLPKGQYEFEFSVSGMPSGVYILRYLEKGKVISRKFSVQN